MNKNIKLIVTIILSAAVVLSLSWLAYGNYWQQPAQPDTQQPAQDNSNKEDEEDKKDKVTMDPSEFPIDLPDGFEIEVLTDKVPGARVIRRGPIGDLWVSRPEAGAVTVIDTNNKGEVSKVYDVVSGLNNPHGLAFDPSNPFKLYIAQSDKVSKLHVYSESTLETAADFSENDNQKYRSLAFGPDNFLYTTTCNGCSKAGDKYTEIQSIDLNNGNLKPYRDNLNSSVYLNWHEIDASMWPADSNVDLNTSATPLGLDFVPEEGWPEKYWYDALIAYHGTDSEDSYKIKRVGLSDTLSAEEREDFITGWKSGGKVLGNPVDIMAEPGGIMYISDDKAGVIYKAIYTGGNEKLITETDDIRLDNLAPNDSIKKNFQITGEGKTEWFFEANVAIEAYSKDGNKIDTFTGTEAPGSQSSKGYMPFTANIDLSDYDGDSVVLKFVKTDYARVPEPDEVIMLPLNLEDDSVSINDKIRINNLSSNDRVSSNFAIKGEAVGPWYFEGDFPVIVHDSESNKTITTTVAQGQGNTMTESFVRFEANVDIGGFQGEEVVVELKKSNPSGKSENDESKFITLRIDSQSKTKKQGNISKGTEEGGCVISGCSNEICADKGMISSCEYKPEYQCYRSATCSRNNNGNCGWEMDKELKSCLNNKKNNVIN